MRCLQRGISMNGKISLWKKTHVVRSFMLLAAISCLSQYAAADTELPRAAIDHLAPASVELDRAELFAYDPDEWGNVMISGEMNGKFPEYRTCAYAAGPIFDLSLVSDPVWETSPGQLATWEDMFLSELDWEGMPDRLVELVRLKITEAAGTPAVGTPVVEDLPNGHVAYVEFDWKCAANPGGSNTLLQGYALRGSTSLQFSYWIYAGREEAVAMATEILAKFEKMDFAKLLK